jgi:uncharacterized MAPEG superfamily protein
MTWLADWYAPRARTFWWIVAGYTSFFTCFGLTWAFAPRIAPIGAPVDRLLLGVQLAAGPALVTMGILQGLWRMNDTIEAESDPLGGKESRRFKVNQRVMSNTIEQTAIFVPLFLALAVRIDPASVFALPWFAAMWCLGRLMFWVGYHLDFPYRAIGMDWTTSSAMLTAIWLVATLF